MSEATPTPRAAAAEQAAWERDGYVLVPDLLAQEEVAALLDAVEHGARVAGTTRAAKDSEGRSAGIAIWHELGDDIWTAASTHPGIVRRAGRFLGEEPAFFHGKVMLKLAGSGGAWEWHQDYGYWYDQGYVFPTLLSVFIALDPCTRENGCLNVLRGSHRLGRLDHGRVGQQTGADPERLRAIEGMFERVEVEMSPGSALFFSSLLLHGSAPNTSPLPRRSYIVCFNALSNPQIGPAQTSERRPCPISEPGAILRAAGR